MGCFYAFQISVGFQERLEGKFVYAWRGANLILLPAGCEDYKASKNYTTLQAKSVKSKELIPGAAYLTKKQGTLVYLGRFDYHWFDKNVHSKGTASAHFEKRYIFWDDKTASFAHCKDLKNIATIQSDTVHNDFAELVDKYHKSVRGTKIVRFFLKEVESRTISSYGYDNEYWYFEEDGWFVECATQHDYTTKKIKMVDRRSRLGVSDGVAIVETYEGYSVPPGSTYKPNTYNYYIKRHESPPQISYREPTNHRLYAALESGTEIRVEYSTFSKD